jgi:hypothetical protein
MKPRSVIAFLRSIADGIDQAEHPSLSLVASDVFGLIAAVESGGAIDAEFAAKFDRIFHRLDLQAGDMNILLVFDLKKAMPEFAAEFDTQLLAMRDAGLYELEPYNKATHGVIPPSYLRAGIKSDDGNLIWVSKAGVDKIEPTSQPEYDIEPTWQEFAVK